jgi:hypothetical protein
MRIGELGQATFNGSLRVMDPATLKAIPKATVWLRSKDGKELAKGFTGADGTFAINMSFPAMPTTDGLYWEVDAAGYKPKKLPANPGTFMGAGADVASMERSSGAAGAEINYTPFIVGGVALVAIVGLYVIFKK